MKIYAAAAAALSLSTSFASATKHDSRRDLMKRLDALEAALTKIDALEADNKAQDAEIKALHASNKAHKAANKDLHDKVTSLEAKALAAPQGGNLRRRQLADDLEEPQSIIGLASLYKQINAISKCVEYDPYYYGGDDACIFGSHYIDHTVVKAAEDIKLEAKDDIDLLADSDNGGSGDVEILGNAILVNATGSGESGDVVIKAVDSLSMDAASSISIDAGASVDITGANSVDIVGSSLDFQAVNGSADFFAENGGDADVFTLGGGDVNIGPEEGGNLNAGAQGGNVTILALGGDASFGALGGDATLGAVGGDANVVAAFVPPGVPFIPSGGGDVNIGSTNNTEIKAGGVVNSNGDVANPFPDDLPSLDLIEEDGMSMSNIEDSTSSVDSEDEE